MYFLTLLVALAIFAYYFLNSAVFGIDPILERSPRIKSSVNYKNGSFQNQSPTEVMRPEASYFEMLKDFFSKPKDTAPAEAIKTVKTDLKNFNPTETAIIWFGHSSYMLFIEGKKILVDPVFTGASPVPFFGQPFAYTENYHPEDFPELDLIIITHDHYDHLDYKSISKLISKTRHFITPLGVDAHLLRWGVNPANITSLDWYESTKIENISYTATPARHFSGRKFKRGNTLWNSYVLKTDSLSLYLGGDSGWDKHFEEIGSKYGPFDLAILECGQYGKDWPNIHMFPTEVLKASENLNSQKLLPVHWGKFALAFHGWTTSVDSLLEVAEGKNKNIFTPQIGEPLYINQENKTTVWWKQ